MNTPHIHRIVCVRLSPEWWRWSRFSIGEIDSLHGELSATVMKRDVVGASIVMCCGKSRIGFLGKLTAGRLRDPRITNLNQRRAIDRVKSPWDDALAQTVSMPPSTSCKITVRTVQSTYRALHRRRKVCVLQHIFQSGSLDLKPQLHQK